MYSLVYTNRMKRDVKLMKKRGRDLDKLICPRKARDKERGVNELRSNSRSRKRAF